MSKLNNRFWSSVSKEAGRLEPELERVADGYSPEAVQEALIGRLIQVIAWSNAGEADFAADDAREACRRIRAELPAVVAEAKREFDKEEAELQAIMTRGCTPAPEKPPLH